VKDDSQVLGNQYTSLVEVNLNSAASKTGIIRLRGWQLFDFLAPPPPDSTDSTAVFREPNPMRPVLIHRYLYSSAKRIYKDETGTNTFYNNTFIDSLSTLDSLQHFSFVNDINARFESYLPDSARWQAEAGLHHELIHFHSHENSAWKQNLGLNATAGLEISKFDFRARSLFIFAGYGAGDYQVDLDVKLKQNNGHNGPVLSIGSKGLSPDLFIQSLYSAHFQWSNNFFRQKESRIGLSWAIPRWKMEMEMNSYMLDNWIYFDQEAKPAQKSTKSYLVTAGLSKFFQAGPLRSKNSVRLNYTAADEIPLPLIVAATSTFMHHDIHFQKTQGLLQLEYGIDVRFSSKYNGFAYMPATGIFYLQNERILGNYPFIDLFLIIRVKRTRFFVKWDHVNSGFMGDDIFPVLHYPVKQRYLKYGVSWHFYD